MIRYGQPLAAPACGLAAWRARETGRAWCRGGLFPGLAAIGCAGFLEQITVCYLQKIDTEQLPITPQSHRAHGGRTEILGRSFGAVVSRFAIIANCRLLAQQLISCAASSPESKVALPSASLVAGPTGIMAVYSAMDQFKYESDHLDFCWLMRKNASIGRRSRSFPKRYQSSTTV